jgi:hypothetical protein
MGLTDGLGVSVDIQGGCVDRSPLSTDLLKGLWACTWKHASTTAALSDWRVSGAELLC